MRSTNPPWSGEVDLAGVGFALGAAAGWAGYILLTKRVGARFTGLAVSMAAASAVTWAVRSEARQAVGDVGEQSSGPKQKTPDEQGSQLVSEGGLEPPRPIKGTSTSS